MFFACFRQFYFLTQTEYFAWAIAFALWPFLAIFKMLSFFEYKLFFAAVFCIKHRNMFVEMFFGCFREFYFLTQTEYLAWAIAFVAVFGHFQNALIFRILAVFWSRFLHKKNSNVFVEMFFACFRQFYFLTQTEYFAWAIAFVAIFGYFQNALTFLILAVFWSGFLHRTTLMCL